jgi:serine/threonine protein kinase
MDDEDRMFSGFEEFESYERGGYHPIALGEVLRDRFRVAHKLGFGNDSTVWLCHDSESGKWRAVKIMKASVSTPDCPDLRAMELFKDVDPAELRANHIQLPLEHFYIDGPNGRHLCLVLPFLGARLDSLGVHSIEGLYGHVPRLMKDICFQMVEALKFLHSHNLCHGDFRPANIYFRLIDGVDEWDDEAIMELLGKPERRWDGYSDDDDDDEPDSASDENDDDEADSETEEEPGIPDYLVRVSHVAYRSGVCRTEIAVSGFGASFPVGEPSDRQYLKIPPPYSAPEAVFSMPRSMGIQSDVWALGVTISEVRRGILPFAEAEGGFYPFVTDCVNRFKGVSHMERVMGPIPQPYRALWRGRWEDTFAAWKHHKDMFANPEPLSDEDWSDETVFTTTMDPHEEYYIRKTEIQEGRSLSWLEYRWHRERPMSIVPEQAEDIATQAAANPDRLPTYRQLREIDGYDSPGGGVLFDWLVKHKIPGPEVEQMIDLFLQIFRWHPEQRATLDHIANHEWFEHRNLRRRAV